MLILVYFYLSLILIAGLLLVTEYSYTLVLLLVLKYKIWGLLPPLQLQYEAVFLTLLIPLVLDIL